jgi:hypothetical protein
MVTPDNSPERDPMVLKHAMLEWYDDEQMRAEQVTGSSISYDDAISTLCDLLAARERGESVGADELNKARHQVQQFPPPQ